MSIMKFIVTYVDTDQDGQCDGKARIATVVSTKEEAKAWVDNDIQEYIDNHTSDNGHCDFVADFDRMRVSDSDQRNYVEWNIESVEILLNDSEIKDIYKTYKESLKTWKDKCRQTGSDFMSFINKCKSTWRSDD